MCRSSPGRKEHFTKYQHHVHHKIAWHVGQVGGILMWVHLQMHMFRGRDTVTTGKAGKISSAELMKEHLLYYLSDIWLDLKEAFKAPLKYYFFEKVFTVFLRFS